MKNLKELKFKVINKLYQNELRKRKFTTRYSYSDRSNNSENLLIIIAGYQPYYWEKIFLKCLGL